MMGLRRGSASGGPLLLTLALLPWQGSAYALVDRPRCVGWRVGGPSNAVNTHTPWGLPPPSRRRRTGQQQSSNDRISSLSLRIPGAPHGSREMVRGGCSRACGSNKGSSSTCCCCGISAVKTGVCFAHNNDGDHGNGSGGSTSPGFSPRVVCDQCGNSYCCNGPPRPPAATEDPTEQPRKPLPRSPLAVCRAPGCGVAFSQCQSCETEYAGCCSVACQTLAAQDGLPPAAAGMATVAAVAGASDLRNPSAGQVALSVAANADGARQTIVSEGDRGEGDSSSIDVLLQDGDASTAAISAAVAPSLATASTPVSQASPSLSSPSGGSERLPGRSTGSQRAELKSTRASTPSGGVEDVGDVAEAVADGGRTAKRQRKDPADEPLLENYASRHSEPESASLAGVREATNRAQPGGAHMVSGHLQGELLKLLTKLSGAQRVLDIGTFTGYSALAFAEALPEDGEVITLESDARAAETARGHFASSGHGGKIRLLQGPAMDAIDQMISEEDSDPFDIIFVDADKKRYWDYLDKVLSGPRPVLAPAGILLADNVLFHELVPLAEATGAAAAAQAATPSEGTPKATSSVETSRGVPPPGAGKEKAEVAAAIGAGVLAPTPRRMKIAESLDAFNKRVREDHRVEVLMLPLRDGLSVVRWRSGSHPGGGGS
ncbi:unnamed protein product [Scytosiphon promiscuus]